MAEIAVVGAGLAGLVAAINCARAGHKVRVLEKHGRVGGDRASHPSVDSTPMHPDRLGGFCGVRLGPPSVNPAAVMHAYAYGERFELDGASMSLHAVERGVRPTSIESALYEQAKEAGVEFEFGWRLQTQADLAQLPPNSIIATGLHPEAFLVLNIPFQMVYGYIAHAKHEADPVAVAYFSELTRDYCYMANANGVAYALFFDRSKPVRKDLVDIWAERLVADEGVRFDDWRPFQGAVAVRRLDNPTMFVGDKIMAGTLASANDPVFLFGVHASLVCGKIAAVAVDDRARGHELYRSLLSFYKPAWLLRRLMDATPDPMRRRLLRGFFGVAKAKPGLYNRMMSYEIPGLRDL